MELPSRKRWWRPTASLHLCPSPKAKGGLPEPRRRACPPYTPPGSLSTICSLTLPLSLPFCSLSQLNTAFYLSPSPPLPALPTPIHPVQPSPFLGKYLNNTWKGGSGNLVGRGGGAWPLETHRWLIPGQFWVFLSFPPALSSASTPGPAPSAPALLIDILFSSFAQDGS